MLAVPPVAVARSQPTADEPECEGQLAELVRLSRNAAPNSAAQFRLHEEIDRIVWR
jgi:hypothetical protein